jgi:hypothetical protein
MSLKFHTTPLRVLFAFAWSFPVIAGPLFPCIKAVSSKNGNFVAVVDLQPKTEQRSAVGPHLISINILPKENFINQKDNFVAPVTYWTDRIVWAVVLDSSRVHNETGCPLPLVSDDGEFLILLQTGPAFAADRSVLEIYRRRDHPGDLMKSGPDHGIFVKSIALADLWPTDRLPTNSVSWTDESPQWFAGGTFAFSEDRRQLIHRTRWGNTIHIDLQDGSLSNQ